MITKDFEIVRGDKTTLEVYVPGDVSARKLSFVVKGSKTLTADRLIQKRNTLFSGSDSELTAVYNSTTAKTLITVYIQKEDTGDFTSSNYFYDIISQSATTITDELTVSAGKFGVIFDVQSDYDGTDLPADAQRYIPVLVPTTVTQAAIEDAILLKHTHSNKATLDLITAAFTTTLKSNYDTAYGWGNHASAGYVLASSKGQANGVVPLNALSLIDSQYLPSYVDDIIEVADYASLPVTGSTGVIYVALDTNYTYRWSGTAYVNVSNPHSHSNKSILDGTQESFTTALKSTYDGYATSKIGLTALSSTATGLTYTNTTGVFSLTSGYVIPTTTQETNWGTAYSHVSLTNNPHSVTASQVGLGNVTNESKSTMFTSPTFTGRMTNSNAGLLIQGTIGSGGTVARTDAGIEIQTSTGPQLSLFATTNPAGVNVNEASIGSFAYDDNGSIIKIGSFSNQFLVRTHNATVGKTRILGTYDDGQTDQALVIYGNKGVDIFREVTNVADVPGINVLRVTGRLKVQQDYNGADLGQVTARGATNPALSMNMGFNTTGGYGFLSALSEGVEYRNMVFALYGGNIGVGSVASSTMKFAVNGAVGLNNTGFVASVSDAAAILGVSKYIYGVNGTNDGLNHVIGFNSTTGKVMIDNGANGSIFGGAVSATSLALGGAAIGSNSLAVNGMVEFATAAADPMLKLQSTESANNWVKYFETRIAMNRSTSSNAGLEIVTSNSGTWGASGGYIALRPNSVTGLRVLTNGFVGIARTSDRTSGNILGILGNVDIEGTITTTGNATFAGSVTVNNSITQSATFSGTNTIQELQNITALTTGTAANGFGLYQNYSAETTDGSAYTMGNIQWTWTDATTASRTSSFSIATRTGAGTVTPRLLVSGNGDVTLGSVAQTGVGNLYTGNATFAGSILASTGSAASPSISFSGDTDSGIYSDGANTLYFGTGATGRAYITDGSFQMRSNMGIKWTDGAVTGNIDLVLLRDAANTLALKNATSAQTFNIYNTYTDASNYERGGISWLSNELLIGAFAKAGTGTNRYPVFTSPIQMYFSAGGTTRYIIQADGMFAPFANNVYDIGATATRFRTGYFGTDIYLDGNLIQSQTSKHIFGTETTDGSYKMYINGSGELVTEKRISGTWTLLHTIS